MSVEDVDLFEGNGPVEMPDPEDSSTMEESEVALSRPLGLVAGVCGVGWGECKGLGCCWGLGGNGASENVGSDSGIGSAVEGIWAMFAGAGYRRPPFWCLPPSLECGVRYERERGRISWHGYISPRERWDQGRCRIGFRGCFHGGRNWEHQAPCGVLVTVT